MCVHDAQKASHKTVLVSLFYPKWCLVIGTVGAVVVIIHTDFCA